MCEVQTRYSWDVVGMMDVGDVSLKIRYRTVRQVNDGRAEVRLMIC